MYVNIKYTHIPYYYTRGRAVDETRSQHVVPPRFFVFDNAFEDVVLVLSPFLSRGELRSDLRIWLVKILVSSRILAHDFAILQDILCQKKRKRLQRNAKQPRITAL